MWNCRNSTIGPFDSPRAFTDDLFSIAIRALPDPLGVLPALRQTFSDDASIVFTHSDLDIGNIMVSTQTVEVLAIIDWRESGWYPDFWDDVKACATASWTEGWKDHIDIFLQPAYVDEQEALEQLDATACYL